MKYVIKKMSIKSMCLYRSPNANYVEGSSGLGVDKENAISPKKLPCGKDKIYNFTSSIFTCLGS